MSLLDPRVWLAVILGLALAYGGGRWQQAGHDKAAYASERTKAALSAAVDQVKAVYSQCIASRSGKSRARDGSQNDDSTNLTGRADGLREVLDGNSLERPVRQV